MSKRGYLLAWAAIAAGLALAAGTLVAYRGRFDYAFELVDIPAVALAAGLVLAGLLVLPLPWLIARTALHERGGGRALLAFVVGVGIVLRAVLFVTEPALEDDYNRYLWDGGVTAHGINPFAQAPAAAIEQGEATAIGRLAISAGVVMERINHPDLKTIYPPVTQAAFALAHRLAPWSLTAWRVLCLGGEIATLALLLALLGETRRSPLWAALYWWNPLIIKEMINSAHMEAILMPLVLAALLLAVRRRPTGSILLLGLAAGAKLWPVLLAPLLLRPLLAHPARLLALDAAARRHARGVGAAAAARRHRRYVGLRCVRQPLADQQRPVSSSRQTGRCNNDARRLGRAAERSRRPRDARRGGGGDRGRRCLAALERRHRPDAESRHRRGGAVFVVAGPVSLVRRLDDAVSRIQSHDLAAGALGAAADLLQLVPFPGPRAVRRVPLWHRLADLAAGVGRPRHRAVAAAGEGAPRRSGGCVAVRASASSFRR